MGLELGQEEKVRWEERNIEFLAINYYVHGPCCSLTRMPLRL